MIFRRKNKDERKDKLSMIIRVDIDNTICKTPGSDYKNAVPNYNRITRINNLYDSGHIIIYWTSRGIKEKKNLRPLTLKQLEDWGCKYHKLDMEKPLFDLLIDDNTLNANEYFYGI